MTTVAPWCFRFIHTITLITNIYILKREYTKRKTAEPAVTKNIYQRMLAVYSLATIICGIGQSFFWLFRTIPLIICPVAGKIGLVFVSASPVLITFYQITRLQYCFLDKQVHSRKYGYPQWIFVVLFIWGLLGGIFYCLSLLLEVTYTNTYYGCLQKAGTSDQYIISTFFSLIAYFLWDWLVLAMYVYKIVQIKRKKQLSSNNPSHQVILKRITDSLNKILFLTLLYELVKCILVTLTVFENNTSIIGIIIECIISFDPVVAPITVYLMIETNNEEYINLITVLYKWKICICCSCLIKGAATSDTIHIQNNIKNNVVVKANVDDTNYETKDHSIKLEHSTYSHQSEETVTIAI
eukprot:437723_1